MRTTVTIGDQLLEDAKTYSGIAETSEVIRHALKTYVELETSRRLARLGGTMPDAWAPDRHRRTRVVEGLMHEDKPGDSDDS